MDSCIPQSQSLLPAWLKSESQVIPDISLYEIRMALKQLKNNKAPSDNGITAEFLKADETPILKDL